MNRNTVMTDGNSYTFSEWRTDIRSYHIQVRVNIMMGVRIYASVFTEGELVECVQIYFHWVNHFSVAVCDSSLKKKQLNCTSTFNSKEKNLTCSFINSRHN